MTVSEPTSEGPTVAVQRLASGGSCPPPPEAPVPTSPREDPRFAKVESEINQTAKQVAKHPKPTTEAKKAAAAAEPPAGDIDAQAKAAHAEKLDAAKPAGFDKKAFIAAVKAAIAAKAPKNLDEADKFATSGKADSVKAEVAGKVTAGKEASAKEIATTTSQTPDASRAKPKKVEPMKAAAPPKPAPPKAGAAMPAKAPPEQTALDAGKCETGAQMAEADVTEEQLTKSNEPEFQGAVAAKKAGEAHSAEAPAQVRESEAATLQNASQGAEQSGREGVEAMVAGRKSATGKVTADQSKAKSADEQARAEITSKIKGIFDATKTDVEKILADLDSSVGEKFEAGEKAAKDAFTADHKGRMERYKDERYSGALGWARWTGDLFAGLPAEANNIFLEAKKLYEAKMEVVISDVADHIGKELQRAKDRVAKGRKEIADYVASQPKKLQKVASAAADEIGSKFDELDSDIDSKQESLVDDLATKYTEARNAVDEEIKELQAANKGLWDKAKDAIGGAIQTILKLKDMLLGVLARAAGAVGKIIKDPIGFLGNLIGAVKSGVLGFGERIVEHLKKALQAWLFGALANAGIEIPETLDLKGIIKLILSVLGLTWTRIRTRIVARIGEAAMNAVEQGAEIFKTLATEGIGGLWKFLVDKLSDLKDTVMDAIQDFVVVKIVKAGITWLISALNPAAAFIKACKMIYDVVMFFVEKGQQIKEFVDSVLDSIESIVSGGVGKVASLIENTLAKILPLLLGFLASLLGLGGISEKIREILEKVQKPVMKVVDAVIKGALKLAGPIIRGVKGLVAKGKAAFAKGKAKLLPAKASADVKAKAKSKLAGMLRGGVDNAGAVESAIATTYAAFRGEGLRSVRVRPGRLGEFDVLVSASKEEVGTTFMLTSLTKLAPKHGEIRMPKSEPEEGKKRATGIMTTALTAKWNGEPIHARFNAEEHKHGEKFEHNPHAEMELIAFVTSNRGVLARAAPGQPDHLEAMITKSPCGDCGRYLASYCRSNGIRLTLILPALHHPQVKGGKQASRDVLLHLLQSGVDLRVPTLDEFASQFEEELTPLSRASWQRKIEKMDMELKKINAEHHRLEKLKAGG
jgi:hypothetical protein